MMTELKRFSLIKPTFQTPFCIDFEWWMVNDTNWKIHLIDCMCEEHKKSFAEIETPQLIDWVDPETAEVQSIDALQHILISHCARQPDFINSYTTLVDAAFRALLANGNNPITVEELAKITGRSDKTLLLTLSGRTVYKGIRPCQKS